MGFWSRLSDWANDVTDVAETVWDTTTDVAETVWDATTDVNDALGIIDLGPRDTTGCGTASTWWVPDRILGLDFRPACKNHDRTFGAGDFLDQLKTELRFSFDIFSSNAFHPLAVSPAIIYPVATSGAAIVSGISGAINNDVGNSNSVPIVQALMGTHGLNSVSDRASDNFQYGSVSDKKLYAQSSIDTLSDAADGDSPDSQLNNDLISKAKSNELLGKEGDDILLGKEDNDTLVGGAGNDFLRGGTGIDFLDGGAGHDTVDFWDEVSGVTADLNSETAIYIGLDGEEVTETMRGFERIYGNRFNDELIGNAKDNDLFGKEGDDILFGGAGNNFLRGGKGADKFIISLSNDGIDKIDDFDSGDKDEVRIMAGNFVDDLTIGALSSEQFVLGSVAQDRNDRFIYDSDNGKLFFDADGAGAFGQVQIAYIQSNRSLSHTDLFLVG